jgi:hypothetical protein
VSGCSESAAQETTNPTDPPRAPRPIGLGMPGRIGVIDLEGIGGQLG